MTQTHLFIKAFFLVATLFMCSCGDVFEKQRRISGNYYIGENEKTGGFSIFYKISNDAYIGKSVGKILEYGFTDKLIVSKNEVNTGIVFYIIDRNKDNEYAEQIDYLIGPLTQHAFDSITKSMNLTIKMQRPE